MKFRIAFLAAGLLAGFFLSSLYHDARQTEVVAREDKTGIAPAPALANNESAPVGSAEASGRLKTAVESESGMPKNDFVDPGILADTFPGNLAIPPVTAEDRERKKRERNERNLAFGKIVANKATEEEIMAYYDHQRRLSRDSQQILEFVLAEYGHRFSEKNIKKHEFLLAQFKKKLEYIPLKESEAIARLRSNETPEQ
ncbi:MAG: hypothetical protein GY737_24415 [Desulfobacteraceae bacterium]|nr:hypothetical protein [Desulfobacteraceae bacterium]